MPFKVNDDESLPIVLKIASKNTVINSLDMYIDIENIFDTYQIINA